MIGRFLFPRFAASAFATFGLVLLALPAPAASRKHRPPQPIPAAPPIEPPKATPVTDETAHDRHSLRDVHQEDAASGVHSFWFAAGDQFSGKDSPEIAGHGLDIEAHFVFDPKVDSDATLISQGGPRLGWAVHFINGKPAFTINYEGLHTTLCAEEPLPPGRVTLRALLGLDGTLALSATGLNLPPRGYAPMTGGFPRQPEEGLEIGRNFGPLSQETFPKSAPFHGDINYVRLSLLPGVPAPAHGN